MTTAAADDLPRLAGVSLDPAVAGAVRGLHALPGAATRASCQGKTASDVGTHADLAYVLFEEPMPLSLEDHFVRDLADLARIEPDGVYARWPEQNRELCAALARAVESRRRAAADERWKTARIPCAMLEAHLESALCAEPVAPLVWCDSCAVVDAGPHRGARTRVLVRERTDLVRARILADFLDRDPHPIDARLREREGDDAILLRILGGAFGQEFRARWRREAAAGATLHRRRELRALVREAASAGRPTDFYVDGGSVVFAVRE